MAVLSGTWTCLATSERLRRSSQSLSVLNSQAWVFGGELLPRQPVDSQFDVIKLSSVEGTTVFRQVSCRTSTYLSLKGSIIGSSAASTLAPPAEVPSPRVGATMTVVKDALYMFSGRGGLEMMPVEENGALWRYTPDTSVWELIKPADPSKPYPSGRSYHAMDSDGDSTIYIHAGCPEKSRMSDFWSFNVLTRSWAELPAAPPPARGGTSIAVSDGRLYRMNGFDGTREQGGSIDVYDLGTNSWSSITFKADGSSGPEPRSVGTLVTANIQGRYYLLTLFGERDPSSLGHAGAGKMLGDVWAFDIEREEWQLIKPTSETKAPAPRGWFGADVVYDQNKNCAVIIHGGLAEDNSRLGDVWKLELA